MKFHEWWVSRDRYWTGNGDESLRLVANAAWEAAQKSISNNTESDAIAKLAEAKKVWDNSMPGDNNYKKHLNLLEAVDNVVSLQQAHIS